MKIELPFDIGDPLHYVEVYEPADRDGIPMAEVFCDQGYTVDGIQYTERGTMILSDGELSAPGGQFACLDEAQAMSWIRKERPGALVLTGAKSVRAVCVDGSGLRIDVSITDCSADLEEYLMNPHCGKMDGNGYAAIYNPSCKADGHPASMFLLDQDGNPVDAMYGPFLLVRMAVREDGLYELVDVDEGVLPGKTQDEVDEEERTAFSPAYRVRFEGLTVEGLCSALLERYPKDARVHVCGTDLFYGHYSPVSNAFCLDASDLSDLPEYERAQPEDYAAARGKGEK